MSDLFLYLALGATFGAVILAGIAVAAPISDRKRSVQMLEAQVGEVTIPVSLRHHQLSSSLPDRALLPVLKRVQMIARSLLLFDMKDRIQRKLALAGTPEGWDVEKVAGLKLMGVVVGAGLAIFIASGVNAVALALLFGLTGFFGPDITLGRMAQARQQEIRKALPDTIDLLTISVEAGLAFDAALAQVVKSVPGPLSSEIARMLQEMRLGISRADAFRHLSERTDVSELSSFILAMVQADVFGISIGNVLRSQAHEMRTKRRQNAEERAMKIPVKILFPLIFCVMPSLFVVVLGPGVIRIFDSLLGR
jgi:tight adherence protein C